MREEIPVQMKFLNFSEFVLSRDKPIMSELTHCALGKTRERAKARASFG